MTRHVTTMTIYDAAHYTDEEREAIIAGYPAHERDARAKGIPSLGSGRIFPIDEEDIKYDPSSITFPNHFYQIAGIDFGWDHPTAAVHLVHDKDSDIIYIKNAYKRREATPLQHAAALKHWGSMMWAWPHDGEQTEKGSGKKMKQHYIDHGLNMLPEHATYPEGGYGVEAGVMDMLERMETNRLKVAAHLVDWFEEFRLYHRKNGKIVDIFDDIMSATRYAIMMIRFAKQIRPVQRERVVIGSGGWMQ